MVRLNSASLEWSKQSGSQQHTRKNVFFSSSQLPPTGPSSVTDRPDSSESSAHHKIHMKTKSTVPS